MMAATTKTAFVGRAVSSTASTITRTKLKPSSSSSFPLSLSRTLSSHGMQIGLLPRQNTNVSQFHGLQPKPRRTTSSSFCMCRLSLFTTVNNTDSIFSDANFSVKKCILTDESNRLVQRLFFSSAAVAPKNRKKSENNDNDPTTETTTTTKMRRRATTMIAVPPNLKIDPRSTCSPFYGMERVVKKNAKKQQKKKEGVAASAARGEGDTMKVVDSTAIVDDKGTVGTESSPSSGAAAAEQTDDIDEKEAEDFVDDNEHEEIHYYDPSTQPKPYIAIPLPQRLHVPIFTLERNEQVGTIHLNEGVFGLDPIRTDILHRVVIYQRNKKRGRRLAKTKSLSEIRGSGRKVRPQKGTGRARAGHARPAHWRGGYKAHGPRGIAQDYTTKINKKVKRLGLKHALSQKLKEGNLIVLNDLMVPTHKTRELARMLDSHDVGGRYGTTAYILDDAPDDENGNGDDVVNVGGMNVNFKVASGNLYKIKVSNQICANVYDILKHEKLMMSLAALTALEERLA